MQHRRTGTVRLGGCDFLARKKNYAIPECVSVEIGMQTHSNCMKSKQFTSLTSNETTVIKKHGCIESLSSPWPLPTVSLIKNLLKDRKRSSFHGSWHSVCSADQLQGRFCCKMDRLNVIQKLRALFETNVSIYYRRSKNKTRHYYTSFEIVFWLQGTPSVRCRPSTNSRKFQDKIYSTPLTYWC